jgi:hypothetical protein
MNMVRLPRFRLPSFLDIGFALSSGILSAIHLCQSAVFSGFALVPGNLGDGRLNNLILEHVYRTWQGIYPLWSPGQFYPTPETLTYSDNHLGTAFIYALFRLTGCDTEDAFQGWLIVICLLNSLSLYGLLRELGVSPWVCVPCVFLGTSSSALIAQTGHPQILPFFPFILTLFFLLRAWRRRNLGYLIPAILFCTYQHFCYLYYGYFCTCILLLLGCAWALAVGPSLRWRKELLPSLRRYFPFIGATSVISVLALLWLYHPYYRLLTGQVDSRELGARPLVELLMNAPRWSSWISAPPFSFLYSGQSFLPPPTEINYAENYLFTGWIVLALGLASLPFLYANRSRRHASLDWQVCACIAFAWMVIVLGLTSWSASGQSPYLFLCTKIAAFRSFRCVSRVAYPLGVLQSVLAALLLQQGWRAPALALRVLALSLAWLIPLEVLCCGQACYSKMIGRDRTDAIVDQWRNLGTSKPLLFAPGNTNQETWAVHLDAWSAALRLKARTFNGYSRSWPSSPGFFHFLSTPTPANGRLLLNELKIPLSSVALVTTWNPSIMQRAGILTELIDPSIVPRTTVKTLSSARGARIEIPVNLWYQGDVPITLAVHNIFLSYRIFDETHRTVDYPPTLRTTVQPLQPGQRIQLNMTVVAPSTPGRYAIHISMVHEGVAWWEDKGWGGDIVELIVP